MILRLNEYERELLVKIFEYYKQASYISVYTRELKVLTLLKEDIVDMIGDYLLEFGTSDGNINTFGLKIESLLDAVNNFSGSTSSDV